jgi:hypothetical protein
MTDHISVKQARDAARHWVGSEGSSIAGFRGAYFAGSATWLADDALIPRTSDLDIMLVLDESNPPNGPGKLIYRGVLLEVSCIARDRLASADQVLGDYHLAGAFRAPNVIADPSGELTTLQSEIAPRYPRREWVRRRCEHAAETARNYARALNQDMSLHDQVTVSAFAAGATTHVLLVAGLRNPTMRRRYSAVRDLLAEYGWSDFHELLLALLGCAAMDRAQVEHHLGTLGAAFDTAKAVRKTPYRFGSDISDAARSISIDGSRELIHLGLHREAVFWIVATYSRCRAILSVDAPEALGQCDAGHTALLADLALEAFRDRRLRCEDVEAFLPRVWQVTEAILSANPEIRD